MKSLQYLVFLLPFLMTGENGFSQFASKEHKLNFAEKITKVWFWTYIDDDTSNVFYIDAMNSIKSVLHRKGYQSEQLFYFKSTGISVNAWREKTIANLAVNEAYLEVNTRLTFDPEKKEAGSARNVAAVSDPSGRVIASYNAPMTGANDGLQQM